MHVEVEVFRVSRSPASADLELESRVEMTRNRGQLGLVVPTCM